MRSLTPLAVLTLGPPLWFGVLWLLSQAGWAAVARRYPQGDRRPAVRRRFRSAAVVRRWLPPLNYNACLTLGTSADGLFLGVFWPFRPFHKPAFVPWAAVEASARKFFFSRYVALRFAEVPGVELWLSEATAADLIDANRAVGPAD